ncbi:MAG: translation initiation factor IF-3 [Acidimicrobiia bacterium]|nr:translation initiation factor IF-3 [Acidimicrobiia bacterium]
MSVLEVYVIAKEPRVNERIRAREVRLVDPDGGQIGIKSIEEARWLADQLGLDLVEVAPDARPPVCRLMDYGKFKYEASVKAREARKKQTRTVIKEVQFRPKIGGNDFEVKRKRAERFLNDGDKVKVTMRFRGREVTHPEIGRAILERLATSVEGIGLVETFPKLEGKQMTMVLAPVAQPKRQAEIEDDDSDQDIPAEVAAVAAVDEASTKAPAEDEDSGRDTPAETESETDEVSTTDETE